MKDRHDRFEKEFGRLLSTSNLQSAFDLAEECLGLLPDDTHLQLLPNVRKHHGIQVDPVYTLLEKLIALKSIEQANSLSKHYMCLLNEDVE